MTAPKIPHFCRIRHGGSAGRAPPPPPPTPPPPIIFEGRNSPQQTIYHWTGNLIASRIHFKYWKNILISRLYEQFSRNDSAKAPQWLQKKFQTFKI